MKATVPYGIVILAQDEVATIRAALTSLPCDIPVVVVDSGSTDGTQALAVGHNAQVVHNKFESFAQQRNWALKNLLPECAWQYHLDADERMTPALHHEASKAANAPPADPVNGYSVPSRLYMNGIHLRFAAGREGRQVRLVRARDAVYVDRGHGQYHSSCMVIRHLKEPYDHHAFAHGIDRWVEKHNRYSSLEALAAEKASLGALWSVLSRDPLVRRRAIKELGYAVPFRPQLRYFHSLILRGGLFDGREGRRYARMVALYESMIALKR